jgi:threonine/homoserine/homoserine lactone efflux protein
MPMSLIFAMIMFSLAMSISPGPVNMVVLSSGIQYGYRKTFPYVSGATIGFTLLLIAVALGFAEFVITNSLLMNILTVCGSLFIIYMGYGVMTSVDKIEGKKGICPRFYQGFLLQLLNPKAWIACVAGVSLFSNANDATQLPLFVFIYFIVCYISLFIWGLLGEKVSVFFNNQRNIIIFNKVMGVALILTSIVMLLERFQLF